MPTHTVKDAQRFRCCGPEGTGLGTGLGQPRYCIGDDCMAWRWVEEFFDRPEQGKLYPVNRGHFEPVLEDGDPLVRGKWIDKWEDKPRMPECKDWVLKPCTDDEDGAPHYWEETPEQAAERFAKAVSARKGYCGYARRPRHD